MALQLTKREAALILASIRNWQEELKTVDLYDYYEGYFEDIDPLEDAQIEDLCARVSAEARIAD
ncbi:MAG: hypothetical protein GEU75_11760 [Dehalococcoidia bacterium]|nr:hypothetical protein [Dehalococcoidia bacterium]